MHLRESRTSKFSGLRQIYPPVTLKYPLEQKLIETPACGQGAVFVCRELNHLDFLDGDGNLRPCLVLLSL